MTDEAWNNHYGRGRADLLYPDENLVRLLKKNLPPAREPSSITGIDLGCGSGRHLKLMSDLRIGKILGLDTSFNALRLSQKHFSGPLLLGDNRHIPLKNDSIDVAIAWGSLHYGRKDELPLMLGEISRILSPAGQLFATLRSSRDTYLKKGNHLGNDTWITQLGDINGSVASFYREDELVYAFSIFAQFECGLMERTLVGDTTALISHWVVHARR